MRSTAPGDRGPGARWLADVAATPRRVVYLEKLVDTDVSGAKDPERVKAMSAAIKDLAKETK